ncbi:MAG: hypothetical protein LWW86_16445 [Micrococcales bacterium]|nr:hypothetical protein [Micrococcales bacterium]
MMTTDTKWEERFTIALRGRLVSGRAIGDALAHIQAYCAESGESPQEAFGSPEEYAASLTFRPADTGSGLGRTVAWGALAMLAIMTALWAGGAWLAGERLTIPVGLVLAAIAGLVGLLAAVPALQLIGRRPWVLWLVLTAAITAMVMLPLLLRRELATISPVLPAVAAFAILAASVGWELTHPNSDEIVDPRQAGEPSRSLVAWLAVHPYTVITGIVLLTLAVPALVEAVA